MIASEAAEHRLPEGRRRSTWLSLLKLPQTWGTIVSKTLTDPVWFFITDWFPIYLLGKGIHGHSNLFTVWIPFIAADLGNFFGGFASGHLIQRGWSLGAALFALATFCYAAFSTIANVFPSDLFHGESVASVSGMSGAGAGIGTIIATGLIGRYSDANQALGTHTFDKIILVAGLVPFVGMLLVLLLVRNTGSTEKGLVRSI